jgi:hypothetical protein
MEVQKPCRPAELRLAREKSGRAERPALHLSACDFAQLVARAQCGLVTMKPH